MIKIKYFIVLFLLTSCVNRTVEKSKNLSEISDSRKETESNNSEEKTSLHLKESSIVDTRNNSEKKEEKENIQSHNSENVSTKNNSETSSRKTTTRKYYPNGSIKSETETSENNSKAIDEKNYYKSIYEEAKSENSFLITSNKSLKEINVDLLFSQSKQEQLLKKYQSLIKQKDLQLNKKTEKTVSIWLYVGLIITGMLFILLLQYTWNKAKKSQWYLILLNKIRNGIQSKNSDQ